MVFGLCVLSFAVWSMVRALLSVIQRPEFRAQLSSRVPEDFVCEYRTGVGEVGGELRWA